MYNCTCRSYISFGMKTHTYKKVNILHVRFILQFFNQLGMYNVTSSFIKLNRLCLFKKNTLDSF